MGRRQVVRHQFLVLASGGSNPSVPAKTITKGDRKLWLQFLHFLQIL